MTNKMISGDLPNIPSDDCQVLLLFKSGSISEGYFWKKSPNNYGPRTGGPHYIEAHFTEALSGSPFSTVGIGTHPNDSIKSWLIINKDLFQHQTS